MINGIRRFDKYIASQSPEAQNKLNELRTILRNALPDAEERISWAMPTFWKGRNIIHFAAFIKLLPFPLSLPKDQKTTQGRFISLFTQSI